MLTLPNFRFSIFSLFLLMTLIAVSVSHWLTSRQLWEEELRGRKNLSTQFHLLKHERPDEVHVMQDTLLFPDFGETPPSDCGWILHLPETKSWRVCWVVGQVPQSGIPAKPSGFRDLPPLEVAQLAFDFGYRDGNNGPATIEFWYGEWLKPLIRWSQPVVNIESRLAWSLDQNAEDWWEDAGAERKKIVSSYPSDQPIVLLRKGFRVPPMQFQQPDAPPADGILVWIEATGRK
ncbi:MAG: hypothetical protein SFU86_00290 [Pirellulaceae bacterium]|nr:hypothetical protein [Pirellulaceae bacterium]